MENWSRKDEWQRPEEKESGENKEYLKNDVMQPLRLEPRGSADNPVTHNSDRQYSRRQLLIFPLKSSCPCWLSRCESPGFLPATFPGPRCYEVS